LESNIEGTNKQEENQNFLSFIERKYLLDTTEKSFCKKQVNT